MSEETINTENQPAEPQTEESKSVDAAESKPAAAAESKPAPAAGNRPAPAAGNRPAPARREYTPRQDRPQRQDYQRNPRFRRKVCRFCTDKEAIIDYKRTDIIGRFITERGKILPRRVTGVCSKHQRAVSKEIKHARILALLPYIEK